MPRPRSFIDGERIRKARTLRCVEPIHEHLAIALTTLPALRFVKRFPGRVSASNRLATDGKKNPVVTVGAEGAIGVDLLVDSESQAVQFYAITSAEQGAGRQMVDDPESQRLERFAGQRVRMAEVTVEVRDRAPCAVVRLVYEMLGFDADGCLDRATFMRQNRALAELVVEGAIPRLAKEDKAVVHAGSRFIARGGCWQPTPTQEREILRAALDETPCKRL